MTLTAPGSLQAGSSAGGPPPPTPARGLVCRNCGATFGLIAEHACAECFGPLEVDYDPELMRAVTREQIEAGPQNTWRYAALLPVGQDPADRVSLAPGLTPLVRADRLAEELGLTGGLWVKDDSANPTHSFKDRVVSMAATAAKGLGYTKTPPPPRRGGVLRLHPQRPRARQGSAVRRLRPDAGRRQRLLRRRQPADQRA